MIQTAAPTPPPAAPVDVAETPSWRTVLAEYAQPRLGRSLLDLATSVLPYFALMVGMYFLAGVSAWLVLAVSVPAAGFLVRTYIVFHDCAHGAFLQGRRANERLGAICGVVVFTPFQRWRHQHAVHHATSGDLERRGVGDLPTLTVSEYRARSWQGRLGYRLFRNPIVMFGVGPIWAMIIGPRIISRRARLRVRRSVWRTNLMLAIVIGLLCWLLGWERFLLIEAPAALLAGAIGIWLFYVQHQFEDAYWQESSSWSYDEAALKGSSYLRLPKVLQFFTGNIGLHHVHHLCTRIPNYNLQAAHDACPVFQQVPTLSLWDGLRCVRLKLWDEERARMVRFRDAHEPSRAPGQPVTAEASLPGS